MSFISLLQSVGGLAGGGLFAIGCFAAEPPSLASAHAHNDYEHPRPLLDALDHGFLNVEADVHLVDGRLLVAHDRDTVQPERTLEKLYLEPLRDRVHRNGGRVYRDGPTLTLLVDVKSAAGPTYTALHAVLQTYAEILTTFRADRIEPGAVTIVVSGNRAPAAMLALPVRYAAMDGRLEDLGGKSSAAFIPWISDNWEKVFGRPWTDPMPDTDREKLLRLVQQAHTEGRRLRFWNTPDRTDAWRLLRDAGVDLINTDDLAGLQAFLLAPPLAAAR